MGSLLQSLYPFPFDKKKSDSDKQKTTGGGKKIAFPQSFYPTPSLHSATVVLWAVIKEKMANLHDFKNFHLEPYMLQWQRGKIQKPGTTPIRVYGELYTSPAFLEAHNEIQKLAGEPGCLLPRVVVGLMFGSDATHTSHLLAVPPFGHATCTLEMSQSIKDVSLPATSVTTLHIFRRYLCCLEYISV